MASPQRPGGRVTDFRFLIPSGGPDAASWRVELLAVLSAFDAPGIVSDDVALVTAELIANAVRHGKGLLSARVAGQDRSIRIEVVDRERAVTRIVVVVANQDGGRGLQMVDQLSTRWGTSGSGAGRVVWAEFEAPATQPVG